MAVCGLEHRYVHPHWGPHATSPATFVTGTRHLQPFPVNNGLCHVTRGPSSARAHTKPIPNHPSQGAQFVCKLLANAAPPPPSHKPLSPCGFFNSLSHSFPNTRLTVRIFHACSRASRKPAACLQGHCGDGCLSRGDGANISRLGLLAGCRGQGHNPTRHTAWHSMTQHGTAQQP